MAFVTSTDLGKLSAIPATTLALIAAGTVTAALASAESFALGYLASRFTLPLTSVGDDTKQAICDIAAYRLMSREGYAPEGNDVELRQRFDDALAWLKDVSRGSVTADVVGTVPSSSLQATVTSATPRGW